MACVIAVDAGTTGVRSLAVDERGQVVDVAYRELTQYYPHPGWVEHDAAEIWAHVAATLTEVARRCAERKSAVAAIGVTNQRETVVTWNRRDGTLLRRAVVWQDRRSTGVCDQWRAAGHLPTVRACTGLVLDPYFSATKMAWLIQDGLDVTADVVFGTVDAWVVWNLTGGAGGGALVTDASNASRTLLYDIGERRWSEELAELFGVPLGALPEVRPSCGSIATVAGSLGSPGSSLHGVAVAAIAGDQQAALFGQACFDPGMAKCTYGTGSFVLAHAGGELPPVHDGLLTTVAWDLGDHGGAAPYAYAFEGAVFVTGAAIQWLRDGLGIITEAAEIGPLAEQVADTEGLYMVPALTGLGSPDWDPLARGTILGITRGIGRAHLARAVVESIAYSVRDVADTMLAAGCAPVRTLRVDGGAAVMDLLLQLQADQLQATVARPTTTETTALGAATLAGLATGVWASLDELASLWALDTEKEPRATRTGADLRHAGWRRAVERSLAWAPA